MNVRDHRELIRLWLIANEGSATETELAALNDRIVTNPEDRRLLIEIAQQQGWLKWNAVDSDLAELLLSQATAHDATGESGTRGGRSSHEWRQAGRRAWDQLRDVAGARRFSVGAVAAALIACVFGFIAGARMNRLEPPVANSEFAPRIHPRATMVSSTGCVWGAGEAGSPFHGKQFASGDMLQLLEGIAEFNIGPSADIRLQMEGPTSMVLASDYGVSLSYGKIILCSMAYNGRPYPVETSFGRILVANGAEVGLIGFGSTAEVHCFQGSVTVESPWFRQGDPSGSSLETLSAGQSLAFDQIGRPALNVRRTVADKQRFTPQVAMNNDFLAVTPEYVEEVVNAAPVAYWRFEETANGVVKNEMGPAYKGRVRGTLNWAGPAGNHVIELGLTENPGSMLVDESWDDVLSGDFSIEFWMKPSHHHLGSMVGFVGAFDPAMRRNTHGVLVEINGPVSHVSPSVNRLRFLHRSPLSAAPTKDASCYSQMPYAARQWQHVVATKEGDQLRLYVNGTLVDSAQNAKATPNGLQLVIGQLYTDALDRFFVGQLDEIAIYDRALSLGEAARHHELLRPQAEAEELL